MVDFNVDRVVALPSAPVANTVYYVKAPDSPFVDTFITGNDNTARGSAARSVYARNAANTADVLGMRLNASSQWELGGDQPVRFGPTNLFAYDQRPKFQIYHDAPFFAGIEYAMRVVVRGIGDNTTYRGAVAGKFIYRDRDDVTAANKGVGYGLHSAVALNAARNNVPFDDVCGLAISNESGVYGASGTDAIYISESSTVAGDKITGVPEWYSIFTADCNATVGYQIVGRISTIGIDMGNSKMPTGKAVRLPSATGIYWRDFANVSDRLLIGVDTSDVIQIGVNAPRAEMQCPLLVSGTIRPGYYTVGTLPTPGGGFNSLGRTAFATDCRALTAAGTLEGAGLGTGTLVVDNGTSWRLAGTNIPASA